MKASHLFLVFLSMVFYGTSSAQEGRSHQAPGPDVLSEATMQYLKDHGEEIQGLKSFEQWKDLEKQGIKEESNQGALPIQETTPNTSTPDKEVL